MYRDLEVQRKWQENNKHKLLLNSARSRAKKKGLLFEIELSDVVIPVRCPILGIRLCVQRGYGRQQDGPSIDRIDNSKGYVKGNVWVISDLANRMKAEATREQLAKFGKWAITQ